MYKLIEVERIYQDTIRPAKQNDDIPDSDKAISDFVLYVEKHLNDAKMRLYQLDTFGAMGEIRKIAALCVAAMENNDTPIRTE